MQFIKINIKSETETDNGKNALKLTNNTVES